MDARKERKTQEQRNTFRSPSGFGKGLALKIESLETGSSDQCWIFRCRLLMTTKCKGAFARPHTSSQTWIHEEIVFWRQSSFLEFHLIQWCILCWFHHRVFWTSKWTCPARKDCQEIIAHGLTMEELESEARQERHGAACAQVSPWLFFCQVWKELP